MIAGNGRWVSLMLKRPKQKGAKRKPKPVLIQAQDEDEDELAGSDTEYGGDEEDVRR